MYFSKQYLFLLASLFLTDCQIACGEEGTVSERHPDTVVAAVNGEPVFADEYRLVMERQVATVYSYFNQQSGKEDCIGYWSESTGPDGPLAKLRELVGEELIRIKVCSSLGKKKGLLADSSFTEFRAAFERENSRRKVAKSAGEVVYGPLQYRMATWYYIRIGDLVFKLKQSLAREREPGIAEEEIREFYERNKESYADRSLDEVKEGIVQFLSLKAAEKELDALCAAARLDVKEELLRAITPRTDPE